MFVFTCVLSWPSWLVISLSFLRSLSFFLFFSFLSFFFLEIEAKDHHISCWIFKTCKCIMGGCHYVPVNNITFYFQSIFWWRQFFDGRSWRVQKEISECTFLKIWRFHFCLFVYLFRDDFVTECLLWLQGPRLNSLTVLVLKFKMQ